MHLRHVVTASWFAISLPLAPISAQETSSTRTTAPDSGRWSFSLGADPARFDLNTRDQGVDANVVANLTRSWQSAHSRWTRQISLMMGGDTPLEVQPYGVTGPLCDCPMRISQRYAGLTAGVSYDIFRLSRFTPYVTGGTGIYYNGYQRSPVREFLTLQELPLYQNGGFAQSKFSVGANAGLGLKIRFGSHDLFIEQRIHRFDINQGGIGVNPFNIGIRF